MQGYYPSQYVSLFKKNQRNTNTYNTLRSNGSTVHFLAISQSSGPKIPHGYPKQVQATMSKLRNIILFLFGTHRLRPRPHYTGQRIASNFSYPQRPAHEGRATPRRVVKRSRHTRKGRGDAAFNDSSTSDTTNSGEATVTATTPADAVQLDNSSSERTGSSDESDILDNSATAEDAGWSSTTPSSTADPYYHYQQEEATMPEARTGATFTTQTPSTRAPTNSSSTSSWPKMWYDVDGGPHLFHRKQIPRTTAHPATSLTEFYNRSPRIPVRQNATSNLRQGQVQHTKKRLTSPSRLIERKQIPVKYPWPVITQRDWREINGIRLWSDRFEKDEYILEDGKQVKKYESRRWKKFVQEIKLSVDKLSQVTKIHMPLPLPGFVIELIEGE